MLPRVLEPEAMDTADEARDYDAMDHAAVNARFVADLSAASGPCRGGETLDVGTGPARIPIALCQADPRARVVATDLAEVMIERARSNVAEAGLSERITCVRANASTLPWPDGWFERVVANSITHHIPDPAPALAEFARLVAPGGTLFMRDLVRPDTEAQLDRLVATYAGTESAAARALFAASLRASFTCAEVREIIVALGLPADGVALTSDRHWTWLWQRPA